MAIRPVQPQDLLAIAEIHKARFSAGHLLGKFSVSFLALLYESYLDGCIFLVHQMGRHIDGFVLGGESRRLAECRLRFARRHWFRCMVETAVRPQIWAAVALQGLGAARARLPSKKNDREQGGIRLLSIAVAESAGGTGVAEQLLDVFEQAIEPISADYGLTVDKGNLRAIRFYERLGFEVRGQGVDYLELHKQLSRGVGSKRKQQAPDA